MPLARRRLLQQRLSGPRFATPAEAVEGFGAVQAQAYAWALWGVAQRTGGADHAAVEQALDAGAILRTHVLRPTWHFVAPADLRWMLALTAPRVKALLAPYDRKLALDAETLARGHGLIVAALAGGASATRPELAAALRAGGIEAQGQRLAHVLMHAELDALVCSGPRRGPHHTYALVDERVPPTPPRAQDEACAELLLRYLHAHGPATPHDFAWWSGLRLTDARAALEELRPQVASETIDDDVYWYARDTPALGEAPALQVHLLPPFDEYLVAYRNRAPLIAPAAAQAFSAAMDAISTPVVLVNGRVAGRWRRTEVGARVEVAVASSVPLGPPEQAALDAAAQRFGRFLGKAVALHPEALQPAPPDLSV